MADFLGLEGITDFSDGALARAWTGPFAKEWSNLPPHPIIALLPCENALIPGSTQRYTAGEVGRAAYWSELLNPPAGVSYTGLVVVNWDTLLPKEKSKVRGGNLPLWRRAMFMAGAKQMAHLVNFMYGINFWRLRPEPKAVASQPGAASPHKFVAAAVTETKDLALVYVPEERSVELAAESLPPAPAAAWYNPANGATISAAPALDGKTCRFQTPQPGDWLLILRAGKR